MVVVVVLVVVLAVVGAAAAVAAIGSKVATEAIVAETFVMKPGTIRIKRRVLFFLRQTPEKEITWSN